MQEIALAAIPNQSFSVNLDNRQYDFTIKQYGTEVSVTLLRDNVLILSGLRIVGGFPIIPYEYLESGNFVLTIENEDLPDYTKFNVSQFLVYASEAELGALRAGT